MKGRIYCEQKCHKCGSTLEYIEGRGIMVCPGHKDVKWRGRSIVRFGRKHTRRFKTVIEAERHLTYLRVQTDKGTFDQREWAKEQPLSFCYLRKKFVETKRKTDITPKQVRHIERVLEIAGKEWDSSQIKDISDGEIEDFLNYDHGISNKTLSNWKTVLHDFWVWVVRRERRKSGIEMPIFPTVSFTLGMKKVISIKDQQDIIAEVKRLTYEKNPRIWLGIAILSLYPRIRPGELLNVREQDINLNEMWIVFPRPKEKDPKFIHLLPQVVELIKAEMKKHPAIPGLYFFRHIKQAKGIKANSRFGPKYFNVWWKRACENLGVDGVSIYVGTKHSTVTALGKRMSPEQIKLNVTGHTSKAFERYFLPDYQEKIAATMEVANMQNASKADVIEFKKQKNESPASE